METDNPIHWLEDELMEIMRIVAKEDDDNIIDAIKLHAVRLLVEVDVERYEALYDRWKARHPEAEPLRTIEDAKAAALNGPKEQLRPYLPLPWRFERVARCHATGEDYGDLFAASGDPVADGIFEKDAAFILAALDATVSEAK